VDKGLAKLDRSGGSRRYDEVVEVIAEPAGRPRPAHGVRAGTVDLRTRTGLRTGSSWSPDVVRVMPDAVFAEEATGCPGVGTLRPSTP